MTFSSRSHRCRLLLVLLLIFVGAGTIRAFSSVYSADPSRIYYPDSASYINTADAVLEIGRFSIDPDQPDTPQIIRTPGYPLFIAGVFLLWSKSSVALIIIQIAISLATIVVTYFIAERMWDDRVALLSALFVALDMPSFLMSQTILTETLFTFLLILAVFAGISAITSPNYRIAWGLMCGTLLSCATLTRPILYYAIFLLIPIFALIWKCSLFHARCGLTNPHHLPVGFANPMGANEECRKHSGRKRKIIPLLAALLLPWLLLVGGWQVRNYLQTGSADLSQIQGINLLFYRGAAILAHQENINFDEAQQRLGYHRYTELHPETSDWSQTELNTSWKREGLCLIAQHPFVFLTQQVKGAINMLLGPGETVLLDYLGMKEQRTGPVRDVLTLPLKAVLRKWLVKQPGLFLVFFVAQLHLLILYGGVCLSACSILYPPKRTAVERTSQQPKMRGVHLFIWGIILYLLFISAGPEAYSRFRIPLIPLFSLYAGHGLFQVFYRLRQRTLQRF